MRKFLAVLFVLFVLTACQSVEAPPVTVHDDPVPIEDAAPPALDTCYAVGSIAERHPSHVFAATEVKVRVRGCVEGSVPVRFSEQQLWRRHDGAAGHLVIFEGELMAGQGVVFAIPYERRSDRFQVTDLRDESVIIAVQNGRERQPW